jgi:UDP-N-acetylbacillosamine N-acetyltransferase
MDKKIVLIGGFTEIIELCNDLEFEKIYVIDRKDIGQNTIYLGSDENIDEFFQVVKNFDFCITPDLPVVRKKIFVNLKKFSFDFPNLLSSSAKVSKTSTIHTGCVVQNGAYISTNVVLGSFVKVNVNACIMHDSKIGSFSTLAPSSTILGRVTIGEMCYIGASATILPEIAICDNVVIGAGAVVTKTITESGIYAGVPARKLE